MSGFSDGLRTALTLWPEAGKDFLLQIKKIPLLGISSALPGHQPLHQHPFVHSSKHPALEPHGLARSGASHPLLSGENMAEHNATGS